MHDQLTAPTGETFTFKKGITDQEIEQLVHFAQTDESVKNFTSDAKRFASRESFNAWRKENTVFYTLNDQAQKLAGIIWLEELPLPEFNPLQLSASNFNNSNYNTTFAIRTYENARGKGLSVPFIKKAFEDFGAKNVWLATSPDNIPAVNAYKKAGFVELGMRKDGQKLIMLLPVV